MILKNDSLPGGHLVAGSIKFVGGHEKGCAGQAGRWRMEYAAELEVAMGSAGALDAFATHSTAANSEVNKEATTKIGSSGVSMRGSVGLCGCVLELAAKGTFYLNCKKGQASISSIAFKGGEQKTRIRAVCEYCDCDPVQRSQFLDYSYVECVLPLYASDPTFFMILGEV